MRYFLGSTLLPLILRFLSYVIPKRNNLIIFGSHIGKRFGDNSGALFQYVSKHHPDEFEYIWLTDSPEVVQFVRQRLRSKAFLKRSLYGIWLSLRAICIVTSYGTSDVLIYKPPHNRLKEIHLSHGVAFRKVLLEKEGGGMRDRLLIREYAKNITFLAVTSEWNAQYQKINIPVADSQIAVTGFPRNDIFYTNFQSKVQQVIQAYGLGQYNILYAPHWRKWGELQFFHFPDFHLNTIVDFLRAHNMCVIIRPHVINARRQQNKGQFLQDLQHCKDVIKTITTDDYPDVQPLLCAADCLVTDYSSILFDYLLLDRPMVFLTHDIKEFIERTGGFHVDYEHFTPGPKPKTQAEFLGYLDAFLQKKDKYKERRAQARNLMHTHQDGYSCARVYKLMEDVLNGCGSKYES